MARALGDNIADFAYIAADHRYSYVVEDIRSWRRIVRPGGIVAGHALDHREVVGGPTWAEVLEHCEEDFVNRVHHGVTRAVAEEFGENYQAENTIWWWPVNKIGTS